ncbi:MAG: hypothetical protein ABJD97_07515 [Betaproteobacteria bacterium]
MNSILSTLFPPVDSVVAVHDSTAAAEAAIQYLGRAGYESRMLAVVSGPDAARPAASTPRRGRVERWGTSGGLWGLLWIAFALAGAALLAGGALPVGAIPLAAALLLAAQVAIASSSLVPEPATRAAWQAPAARHARYASELAGDGVLLMVNGSRSEIALARTLLRLRHGAAPSAVAP